MTAKKLNFVIRQGETFTRIIRWETPPFIYRAITAVTNAAPVAITSVAHGLKSGWRVAVVSVRGMEQINAERSPPRDSDFEQCTVTSNDVVTLNRVNTSDYDPYLSGGYLCFYTPVSLGGYEARMKIKDKVGGTVLVTMTSDPPDNQITIDPTENTITLTISATETETFTFSRGVYDLEMVSPAGTVTAIFSGTIQVTKEVTTTT